MYRKSLSRLSAASWVMRLWPVPVGLLTASLTADAVTAASEGRVSDVLLCGGLLLLTVVLTKIIQIVTGTAYRKAEAKRLHSCKMALYERFLSSPLHFLCGSSGVGDAKEKLTDDFSNVTGKRLSLIPGFFAALITAAAYFAAVAMGSLPISLSLLGISLLQFIPPIIVKRYLEKNYRDCRDIEAAITDHTVAGLRGFSEIKIFDLGGWWDKRMADYHKEYLKIGYGTDLAGTVESSMDSLLSLILRYGSCAVIGMLILFGRADVPTGVRAIALSGAFFAAVKTMFDSIPRFGIAKEAEKRLSQWVGRDEPGVTPDGSGIRLRDVSVSVGGRPLLSGVSADIGKSGITVIRGENGSGKSTLLKTIAGIVPPDSGSAEIGGAETGRLSPETFPKAVFYLPQDDADISFTPGEIYDYLGVPDAPERAGFPGLDAETADRKISELSGGERKKAYLSAAFALQPEYMLLDEPTNSLDADGCGRLISLLGERRENGLGAVIVTHDARLIAMADKMITVKDVGISVEG